MTISTFLFLRPLETLRSQVSWTICPLVWITSISTCLDFLDFFFLQDFLQDELDELEDEQDELEEELEQDEEELEDEQDELEDDELDEEQS